MNNSMTFILLFGGISIILFFIASGLSTPPTHAGTKKPNKVITHIYIIAIVFIITAIIIFWSSSFTLGDLVEFIKQL